MGVDLLITFLKLQHTSDWLGPLEGFVPLLCRDASPTSPPPSSSSSSQQQQQQKKKHSPDGVDNYDEQCAHLQAACLRALLEHLRYCRRIEYVSHQLTPIMFAVLETMETEFTASSPPRVARAGVTATRISTSKAPQFSRRMSIGESAEASPPPLAATIIFQEIALMTRDVAEGSRVINLFLRFLDSRGRWLTTTTAATRGSQNGEEEEEEEEGEGTMSMNKTVAAKGFKILKDACERWQHRYLFYVALITHTAEAVGISEEERAAVVEAVYQEATSLDAALTMPALRLALGALPQALKASGTTSHHHLWRASSKLIEMLSKRLESNLLVTECIMAALPRYDADVFSLKCCVLALQARLTGDSSTTRSGTGKKGRGMGGTGENMIAHQLLLKLTGILAAHEISTSNDDNNNHNNSSSSRSNYVSASSTHQQSRVVLAGQLLTLTLKHGGGGDSGRGGLSIRPKQMHIILSSLWYLLVRGDTATPTTYIVVDDVLRTAAESSRGSCTSDDDDNEYSSAIAQFFCTLRYSSELKTLSPHRQCAVFFLCASIAKRVTVGRRKKMSSGSGVVVFDENSDRYAQALADSLTEDEDGGGLKALSGEFSKQDEERAAALLAELGGGDGVYGEHSRERYRAALDCTAAGDFVPHGLGGALMHGELHSDDDGGRKKGEESEWLKQLRRAAVQWKAEEEQKEEADQYVDATEAKTEEELEEEEEGKHVSLDEVMASIKKRLEEE